jgi:hypothetical protein
VSRGQRGGSPTVVNLIVTNKNVINFKSFTMFNRKCLGCFLLIIFQLFKIFSAKLLATFVHSQSYKSFTRRNNSFSPYRG